MITSRKKGHAREEWQKVTEHAANHYWDYKCYALAAAEVIGVRYFPDLKNRQTFGNAENTELFARDSWIRGRERTKFWLDP